MLATANAQTANPAGDDSDVEEIDPEATKSIKVLESMSTFDEVVVWGHDQAPAADDRFVKGFEEWIGFATAIHQT